MNMQVRATLRIRNEAMLSARERLGLSQVEASDLAGMPTSRYQRLERMDFAAQNVAQDAVDAANALGIGAEEVMPEGAQGKTAESKHVRVAYVPLAPLLEAHGRADQRFLLPDPSEKAGLSEAIEIALGFLDDREKFVIEKRWLSDEQMTLKAVGEEMGICPERVRNIEHQAIWSLRSGRPRDALEDYASEEISEESSITKKNVKILHAQVSKVTGILEDCADKLIELGYRRTTVNNYSLMIHSFYRAWTIVIEKDNTLCLAMSPQGEEIVALRTRKDGAHMATLVHEFVEREKEKRPWAH